MPMKRRKGGYVGNRIGVIRSFGGRRGAGFGDFIGSTLGGLGSGLGSGVHNLFGTLFGGGRKRRKRRGGALPVKF